MNNIFISPLSDRLSSWSEAFVDSKLVNSIAQVSIDRETEVVFWIHKNQSSNSLTQNSDHALLALSETMLTIFTEYPLAKIVILANLPQQSEAIQALRLGALGYCHAYSDPAMLIEVREVISRGGLWIGQDFLRRLIENSTKVLGTQQVYIDGLLAKLTAREQEVALEAAKGLSNKEIARNLKITERTVKAHMAHVFERVGAKDRLQLALMLNQQNPLS